MIICLLLCSCSKKTTDAELFKKEFESYNNEKYYNVSINKDNPFVYADVEKLNDLIADKESFAVFIGSSEDDLSRHFVEFIIEEADYLDIKKVYYLSNDDKDITTFKSVNGISSKIPNLVSFKDGAQVDKYTLNIEESYNAKENFDDLYHTDIKYRIKKVLEKITKSK